MSQRLNVRVDHSRCVGNAMCVEIGPRAFRHNENRQSEIIDAAGESVETVLEAASSCPTGAISVADADTGEVLFSMDS